MTIASNKLNLTGRTSRQFLTKGAIRGEFKVWNKAWKRRWRMRIVSVEGGGYAAVIRPKGGWR